MRSVKYTELKLNHTYNVIIDEIYAPVVPT